MAYNEPSGSSLIFSTAFNNLSGMLDDYNSVQIRTDATAPYSPSNCMFSYLAAGSLTGGCQIRVQPGSTWNDMYVRKWWRTNAGFQGRTVGNKMFFMRGNTTNGCFLFNNASLNNGYGTMIFAHNTGGGLDNSHIWSDQFGATGYPNVGSGQLHVGEWFMLEAYIKCSTNSTSRDGIVRWWVNGILAGDYTTVNYPGGLNNWCWSETWDGTPGYTFATVQWEHWIDDLYISTGGTVTPSPSVPTIASITPTSGPVGTPLTIVGTNFDPTPSGNAVTVNNVACTVLAVVPTQINTAIPNTGTTGQVKVVTSAGTALGGTFTVTAPDPGGGTGGGTGGGAGSTTYTYATEFSGTQGPRWYYLDGNSTQLSYNSGSGIWMGSEAYQWIWSDGFHPGTVAGTILKFIVPGTGSVSITGQAQDTDTGGGNGAIFILKKNGSTTLFTRTMNNGDTTGGDYSVTSSVVDGDYFTFEVTCRGENSYDATKLNPVIVYTPQSQSIETITLALTSLALTESTTGIITLTITPTRATESVVTLTSSNASAVIAGSTSIPANTGSVQVQVLAGTPGSATITATLGTSSTTSTVTSVAVVVTPPGDPVPATPTLSAYTDFLVTYRLF